MGGIPGLGHRLLGGLPRRRGVGPPAVGWQALDAESREAKLRPTRSDTEVTVLKAKSKRRKQVAIFLPVA